MSSEPAAKPSKASPGILERGNYRRDVAGTVTFVGLRAAEPLLQYSILRNGLGLGLLHKMGFSTLPAGPPNTGTFLDVLGLSPYRLILLGMTTTIALRQIAWNVHIAHTTFGIAPAIFVSVTNGALNAIFNWAFTTTALSASLSGSGAFPQTPLIIGSVLFLGGIALEHGSDWERKVFKDDSKNAGKIYTGGTWKYVRHPNYLGYTLWRAGHAMACGGYAFSAAIAALFIANFVFVGIPEQEEYLAPKYGAQWTEYEKKTPWKLIPYIY